MLLKAKTAKQRESAVSAQMYRMPIPVREVLMFSDGACFPICPRCDRSIDRAYMSYCDRCGQCLSWVFFDFAAVILAPRHKTK